MAADELVLERIDDAAQLERVVDEVFADAEVRRGMGWTEADDPEEARAAIRGLWRRRLEAGWRLFDVSLEDRRAGLVGLGPVDEADGTVWYAVYLLERGQGLGGRLTRRAIERARREGARELVAVTWAKNEASRGLLEAEGFEPAGEAPYDWARESALTWLEYRRPLNTC